MAQITIDIPSQYVDRLLNAIKGIYPIPQITNPDYEENPENPSGYDYDIPQYINQYSDVAWAKIKIRDFLSNTLSRYEQRQAINTAIDGVDVPGDLSS